MPNIILIKINNNLIFNLKIINFKIIKIKILIYLKKKNN